MLSEEEVAASRGLSVETVRGMRRWGLVNRVHGLTPGGDFWYGNQESGEGAFDMAFRDWTVVVLTEEHRDRFIHEIEEMREQGIKIPIQLGKVSTLLKASRENLGQRREGESFS